MILLTISDSEIKQQEAQIASSADVDLWCRQKYTNEKLYTWMDNSLRKTFQDTYTLTAELAYKAKRALEFEIGRGRTIALRNTGYWDSSRDRISTWI